MRLSFNCLLVGFLALICSLNTQAQDQLVVFVQPGRSISQDFIRTGLPKIKALAEQRKLTLKVVDATKGAPAEVTHTPAIFLQKNGSSKPFIGRYRDMDDLSAFLQSNGSNGTQPRIDQLQTVVWKAGRTTLAAHFDVEPLQGKLPSDMDEKQFKQQAEQFLMEGMAYLKPIRSSDLPSTARSFFMKFRPEHTDDGLMLVHMSLYSAFDLETPVFDTSIPSGSEWNEWESAFGKAGQRLEAMLIAQISSNENGDGFEPVKGQVPTKPWNALVEVTVDPSVMPASRGVGK